MTNLVVGEIISNSLNAASCAVEMNKTIFRAEHNKLHPYTMISNALLRDCRLKNADRGMMVYLLSFSDMHKICLKALAKKMVEGKDAITATIGRLIDFGYIVKHVIKDSKGRFAGVVYHIFESPQGKQFATVYDKVEGNTDDGIGEESEQIETAQLGLFDVLPVSQEMPKEYSNVTQKAESVKQSTTGKPDCGKPATNNKYIEEIIFNSNNPPEKQKREVLEKAEPITKQSLLNKWHKKLDDHVVFSYIARSGLQTLIRSQDDLDRFLIDFNQQHEQYAHLSETARMKNFISYLVRVKSTPVEYRKHVARMKALGFDIELPKKPRQQTEKQQQTAARIKQQQESVNPFEVQPTQHVTVSDEFRKLVEGF